VIRLHALGTVELRRADGADVVSVTAQPKRLALLVYLAVARPRGFHRRDTLIGLFWPESTEERARSALAQALYFLRRSLGSDVIISRGSDEVGVSADRLWCDAAAVYDALNEDRVENALELYRGDLLAGLYLPGARGFEEWLERERANLRRAVLDAASARAPQLEASDPRSAADLLRRALAVAPEDESMLRRLMQLLDTGGDRAGALAAFDEFERRMAAELEIEPSPETKALRARIAARTMGAQAAGPQVEPSRSDTEPGQEDERPQGVTPTVIESPARVTAPTRPRTHRASRRAAAVFLIASSVAAAILIRAMTTANTVEAGRFTLAVAPFTPATADSALMRIARELVVPLSANLDGLGDVHAVEGVEVLAAGGAGAASEAALELARQLGATRVLYGAIVTAGTGIRAEATLRSVADGQRLLRVTVMSERDVSALADSLTWAVLRELWRDRGVAADTGRISPSFPAAPALDTHSLPALRAYWNGERAVAQDRWSDAAEHFARAVALDTTYWFAYWRYGYARSTVDAPVEPHIRAAYEARRFEFPARDRLLIEARMADSLSERIALHRDVTQRLPGYWQGWWDYANRLVHDGPFLGSTDREAREALQRTLALRPNDVIVLQHLFWVAAYDSDLRTMEHVVRRTRELRSATPDFQPPNPDYLLLFDLTLAAARGDNEAELTHQIDRNIAHIAQAVHGAQGDRFSLGPASYGYHHALIVFAHQMLESSAAPELKAAQRRALALTWAARGGWDSAMVAAQQYTDAVDGPAPIQHMLRLAVAGEWLDALPRATTDSWRERLTRYEPDLHVLHQAELAWLAGVLAASRDSPDSIASARRRLRNLAGSLDWRQPPSLKQAHADSTDPDIVLRMLDASLEAFELAARGDPRRAGQALAELERQRAEHGWVKAPAQWHPYLTALNRLAAAQWLRESGRPDQVDRLLTWVEAVEFPAYHAAEASAVFTATAYYERALAAESLGRDDVARRHYARFLRRHDAPTPTHRERVERARRVLAMGEPRAR
jgi:DNA-binding SARP family transcriptional activator/TolB-like protein